MGLSIHRVVVFVWDSIITWMLLWKRVIVYVGLLYSMGRYTPRVYVLCLSSRQSTYWKFFHISEQCVHLVFRNSWCKAGTHRVIFVPKFCYNCVLLLFYNLS